MLNRFLFFLAVLLFSQTAKAALLDAEEFFLSNGLRVVVVENHKAPIIKQMLWYKVGAINDGLGKGGRAHFLEHLMFRGTDKLKDGEFNNLMEDNGVSSNAFTGYEVTAYHEFADISKLELLMAAEADRMVNLNFDEQAFNKEKQVVIQERKQVVENDPTAPFFERLRQIIWGNNSFGRPVTGLIEEIEDLTYKDVRDFYKLHYRPNNAILVLAGDIDVETAKKLAEKYFGSIKTPPIKGRRKSVPILREKFNQRLEMSLAHIQSPKIILRYILPPYSELSGNLYDYEALAQYLGEGKNSALYQDLVLDSKVALSVSVNFSYISKSNTEFTISLIPADGISITEAEQALVEALHSAIIKLNAKKLISIKKKMVADVVYIRDNPSDSANIVGYILTAGFPLEHLQNYEEDVEKITLNGIKNAYREVFFNSSKVIGVLLPQTEEKK